MTMPPEEPVEPTEPEEPQEPEAPAEDQIRDLGLGIELTGPEREEAEQMVARLKSQFGLDGQEPVEGEAEPEEAPGDEPEPQDEPEPEPAPEVPEPAPASADDWISIDGRAVPVAEARSMLELRQYLAQNPEKAEAVRKAIEDEAAPPVPEPPKPPEWLDLDDPAQRFMWEQNQRLEAAVSSLHQNQQQAAQEQARVRALGDVQHAMDTFRRNHPELTEDDIQTVRVHAVALNIIPGLQQSRSGTDAVLKALDIAYLDHPEFRSRATGTPSPAEAKAKQSASRKQKLGGLAGSSSAAPRQPEAPKRPENDREARAQAAEWLREQNIL